MNQPAEPTEALGVTSGSDIEDREYGYSVVLAESFEEILDGTTDRSRYVGVAEFAQVLRRSACTLLQARGGAGKSHTARRLISTMSEQGVWSVEVPAVDLGLRADELTTWSPSTWSEFSHDTGTADQADQGAPGLVVIDGLNEVSRATSEVILDAIGHLTALDPQVTFLVTDRLTRRPTVSPHWRYATLSPVPPTVVSEITGAEPTEALGVPFYLERHDIGSEPSKILRDSITRFIAPQQVPSLAKAAFSSYERLRRRELDRTLVEAAVGQEAWRLMREAKEIVGGDGPGSGPLRFVHHLLHDFLAGSHLAANPQTWNAAAFDVVSLNASSFDALSLALTQVEDQESVDDLVVAVYDWNFYAAAYMLSELGVRESRLGTNVSIAIQGALAEKLFDPVVPTAIRVEDALRVQRSPTASALLKAEGREEVVVTLRMQIDAGASATPWFATWWDLFERPDGSPAISDDLDHIAGEHPLLGWAAANALRRFELSPVQLGELRDLLADDTKTVRWRAAHALGTHALPENMEALLALLEREPRGSWTAYGALRSVFEQLRAAPDRAEHASRVASDLAPLLASTGNLRQEAIRCLDVDPLPAGWHRDVEPILQVLWDTADARGAAELAALAERLRRRRDASIVAHG